MKRFLTTVLTVILTIVLAAGAAAGIYFIPEVQTIKRAGGSERVVSGQRERGCSLSEQ